MYYELQYYLLVLVKQASLLVKADQRFATYKFNFGQGFLVPENPKPLEYSTVLAFGSTLQQYNNNTIQLVETKISCKPCAWFPRMVRMYTIATQPPGQF